MSGRSGWRICASGLLFAAALSGCRGPEPITTCAAADGVTPVCRFQNPEDLAVSSWTPEWLLVSQAPRGDSLGTLIGFRPSDGVSRTLWPAGAADSESAGGASQPPGTGDEACPGPPAAADFTPHGIDVSRDGRTLFAVNHGGRESVELFRITRDADREPKLDWTGCVLMPDGAMMNDVAALPEGGFVVTKIASKGVGMLSLMIGRPSGEVFEWQRGAQLTPVPNSEGSGPNGVAVAPDGESIYFSEWIGENLVRIGRDGGDRNEIPLGFNPDNLTWRSDGSLLIAGQSASPADATRCLDLEEGACGLPSAAAVYDPQTDTLTPIWNHDPATVIGGVSVALEHDGKIWLGAFSGDRLAWIQAP